MAICNIFETYAATNLKSPPPLKRLGPGGDLDRPKNSSWAFLLFVQVLRDDVHILLNLAHALKIEIVYLSVPLSLGLGNKTENADKLHCNATEMLRILNVE